MFVERKVDGETGLEAPVLWLLLQVASSLCVCSICMPVRSIILVVETLSATIRRHSLAPRQWNSRIDLLVPPKGVLTSVLKLDFLTHRWLICRLNITKSFHSKQVERSTIRYSSLLLVGLYLPAPALLQYCQLVSRKHNIFTYGDNRLYTDMDNDISLLSTEFGPGKEN